MKLQISLRTVEEVDSEVLEWMQLAFDENYAMERWSSGVIAVE